MADDLKIKKTRLGVRQKEQRVLMNFRFPTGTRAKLRELKEQTGMNMTAILQTAVDMLALEKPPTDLTGENYEADRD